MAVAALVVVVMALGHLVVLVHALVVVVLPRLHVVVLVHPRMRVMVASGHVVVLMNALVGVVVALRYVMMDVAPGTLNVHALVRVVVNHGARRVRVVRLPRRPRRMDLGDVPGLGNPPDVRRARRDVAPTHVNTPSLQMCGRPGGAVLKPLVSTAPPAGPPAPAGSCKAARGTTS
jgi:hypothetical protein